MRAVTFTPLHRPTHPGGLAGLLLAVGCLALAGSGASCEKDRGPQRQRYLSDQVRDLQNANVAKEVDAAVNKADYRFVAVNDHGIMIPGIEDADIKVVQARYGIRFIENTTDKPSSKQEEELQNAAWGYAAEYNKLLRRKLPSR